MLSTFPATFPSETMFSNSFPSFSDVFPKWDCSELISTLQSPNTISSSSPPGEDDPTPPASTYSVSDERKRKRKISNRESARRSRMRKQKHLENLTNHVNRLRHENKELTDRLRFTMSLCHRFIADNEQLRCEQAALRQRLDELSKVFVVRQMMMHEQFTSTTAGFSWPCNNANVTNTSEQSPSLITY